MILQAHDDVSRVLSLEKELATNFPSKQKYSFERKGNVLKKVYSKAYVEAYHALLGGQVVRQMRASIQSVCNFWLTCWIHAGRPNLDDLLAYPLDEFQIQENFKGPKQVPARVCEDYFNF